MYCLDKLQREIAYFFSKDIRELPKVESLLAEAGYTQIRKGDEIIEIDSALGRHSTDLGDSRAVITDKVTPTLESPKNHESPTATPRILETESTQTQKSLFDTQEPTLPKVDSSVESTPPKNTLESTSTPAPSQPPQAQRLKEALQIPLTDDRGLQFLAFGRVGSEAEIMEQVLIPQARNAYRKGTSQNKLKVGAINTLKKHRQDLEQSLNITPIKEFGTNYAEHYHSGESAIAKLLLERNGQVAGAFHRKELGDIDLVWGEVQGSGKEAKGWGLAKIIEKHGDEFKDIGKELDEIIRDGEVVKRAGRDEAYNIEYNGFKVGINKGFNKQGENKWIVTAFDDNVEKTAKTAPANDSTKGADLPLNSSDIIPQQTQKSLFDTQETTLPKVDSSVESYTKHQDYNTFNQSLKDAHDFFKANNKDTYNDKLFDDVIKVANALDIRFWYQPNAVYMAGSYTYRLNRIMLQSDNFSKENANTILHELIHSVTSRAIYAYDNKALREKLSKEQIEAIAELKNLYKEVSENNADKVWQKMATFKDELENNKGKLYGLKNEHEMLAELAKPSFREFLKEQNIFSKIIEAMVKIFSYVKDKLTGESIKSTNAQSELETILYKIMDNYTNPHAFTNEMSEHFGSRNFVDTARYKEYIKYHKQKFDKDNGKSMFSFFDKMNHTTKNALSGRNSFIRHFLIRAGFNDKDTKLVDEIRAKWTNANTRPENLIDLKTAENAHIFRDAAQAQEDNIKDFVKEYYGVSYDEFNNAFNGAMKDKHFYEAKDWKYLGAFKGDIPSKETAFLLALKPYFTSGLYKLLNEADFNVIKDSLYRILQDENLTYRNKPINEWFAKEWVEQDVKALQESFQYKLEQPQGQKGDELTLFDRDLNINFNAPMKDIKPQLLAALKPIFNQTMTSADGKVQAYMSLKSLSKMTSDKAIQKSIDNGFSREKHLRAVLDIQRLFENARLQATEPHKSGEKNAVIHRLNSELESGNALITTKESLDINKNRIYSIELELTPRFNDSSTPLNTKASAGGFNSQKGHQEQTIKAEPSIAKTDEQSIAQDSIKVQKVDSMLESKAKTQGQRVEIAIPKEKDFFKNLRNKAKETLAARKGQKVQNISSGMFASVSSDGISKMISSKAVDKSIHNGYTKEEHFASVENVLSLFKISELAHSEKPNNKSADVIAYHKFIADFSINHKPTKAKITLRETLQAGNKIYSLELLELEKASN